MRISLKFLLTIIIFISGCKEDLNPKSKALDTFVRECHNFGLFNGAVLVASGGELLYKNGYGYTDQESKRSIKTTTAFYLASVSKQFTTMAIMILKERGKLSYDDNLKKYFSDFPDYAKKISIRQMMTHTSGLPDHYSLITKNQGITNSDVLEVLQNQSELLFEPGTNYRYSNGAYVLLSLIVEQVSGQPFPQFMKENIFDPLNMTNTLIFCQNSPTIKDRATGYNLYGKKKDYSHFTSGAGGMYTTVEDLFKWDRSLYRTDLISVETREEAFKPQTSSRDSSIHYGFGWTIRFEGEEKILAHSGGLAGYSTYIERYPDSENTIIFLSNIGIPMPWMMQGIRNILNNKSTDLPKIPVSLKMEQIIKESGIDDALEFYKSIIADKNDAYDFSESLLNAYGYYLLSEQRISDAIKIFKCNVMSYPDSPNVYDSLGDAYETNSQFINAAQNYMRALQIEQSVHGEEVSTYRSNLDRVNKKLAAH